MTDLTPIDDFRGWWAKRDDVAFASTADAPSGSKVRQYARMAARLGRAPMIVGCSAHSAMQIYIAAGARAAGVKGIVYTAARAVRTDATEYAARLGAEVVEVRPAYLNVVQSRAHDRAATLKGGYVKWDVKGAVLDAAEQVAGIPDGAKRIIVPTGSGLTAAGVLAGLYLAGLKIPVVCVAVSAMAEPDDIKTKAKEAIATRSGTLNAVRLSPLRIIRAPSKYEQWVGAVLPDGTPLDPYYSAKAVRYLRKGDLLWLPGVRPVCAMPAMCQEAIGGLLRAPGRGWDGVKFKGV